MKNNYQKHEKYAKINGKIYNFGRYMGGPGPRTLVGNDLKQVQKYYEENRHRRIHTS